MEKEFLKKVRLFAMLHQVVVSITAGDKNYNIGPQGQAWEITKDEETGRPCRCSIEYAEIAGLKHLGTLWVRVLKKGQTLDDVRALRGDEFWYMIDGEFKSPEKFRAVQRRFFSHDWVRGTDLEGWIDGLTRPAIRVVTASGQTVLVSPRIQDQFTLKQLSFMLDQVEDMKIDEPHSGMGPDYVVREFDSGRRSFGRTACVETREGDDLFYASLGGQNWGRFVRGRKPEPCSWLTVILRKMGGAYEVRAAYVGRKNPAWPGDPNERGDESRKFWKNHALLDGTLPYLEGTVTRKAPWWFKKDGVREDRIRRGVAPHHSAVVDRG